MDCIQLSLFGRTCQELLVQTAEKISEPCWKNLPASNSQTLLFLDLRGGADGAKPEQSPETDGLWLGASSTLNIGESPNVENVSLLSSTLEANAPEKYYLSARACQGILTRASRRGKRLPELLEAALLEMIEWWQRGGRNAAYTLKIRSGCAGGGKGALVQTEKTGTLSTLQDQTLFQAIPVLNDQGGGAMSVSYNMTGTLRASEHGHQPIVLESNQVHATVSQTGICPTLPASMGLGGGYVPMVTERKIFDARGNGDGQIVPTITGDRESRITDYTAFAVERKTMKKIAWIVRRLTPMECERLQGYPNGWTDIGEWVDSKGKKHKYADSPRYKALGNSIALPQWFWIAQKMKPYLSENATLGSLFDGIGGFPLVWQKTYGNGTARWASEVDSFCIAVTKRRFGEE